MSVLETLTSLRAEPEFMRDVTAWERAPAQPARHAAFPAKLDPAIREALKRRGIEALYTHQAQTIEAVLNRQNVVVVASAAGGKSLCFHAPIAQAMLSDSAARALCLFPTKALSQDQYTHLYSLLELLEKQDRISNLQSLISIYDGDTPQSRRSDIRRDARVVITNADMLHLGILPHHTRWAAFLKNLRYVVIDELHAYRGIFGSHLANVIRRLKRLCAFYGSNPIFILASATIANPREHAERLLEAPVALVDDDGSPHGERHVLVMNPPLVDAELGIRRSSVFVARDIAARFIADGAQTICFARSRQDTEVLLTYLRNVVKEEPNEEPVDAWPASRKSPISNLPFLSDNPKSKIQNPKSSIAGYRGGYLPEERRAIEAALRHGEARGVVATNALELGIDVGELDACVMLGYPGSIASFWQQAGRAGRRRNASAAVMVASASALDQYLASHPEYLFKQSPEHARISPDNLGVLAAHVACATFELPFLRGEGLGRANVDDLLDVLVEEGDVFASGAETSPLFRPPAKGSQGASQSPNANPKPKTANPKSRYTWVGDSYPADAVSLRGVGDRVIVVDGDNEEGDRLIGETERATAPGRVFPGAIYMHQAEMYQITHLDWEEGRATAHRVDVDYFTDPSIHSEVMVLQEYTARPASGIVKAEGDAEAEAKQVSIALGEVEVTTQARRYRQVQFNTHRTLGWGQIDLPAQHLYTTGYWFAIPEEITQQLAREGVLKLPNDYGPNWQRQRDSARARDNYRCTVCGAPEPPGRQHDVHHKKPFREFGYIRGENEHYLQANDLANLVTVCSNCHHEIETAEATRTALEGLSYLVGNLASLFVMCDPGDLATVGDIRSAHTRLPTITVYELTPGGTGLTDELFEHHAELLKMAAQRIRECPCEHGCPACVGPIDEAVQSRDLKADTLRLIGMLLPEA